MKVFFSTLALLCVALLVNTVSAEVRPVEGDKGKPNAARLKGMKEALADIEKGKLKQKSLPLPDPAWYADYLELLKKECGIEMVLVTDEVDAAEMAGYNEVMRLEIEHRFGQDIMERLHEKAKKEYFKKQGVVT
jgi:hypothetical protein